MGKRPINVLIVEDSPAVQSLLKHVIDSDPQLRVIGTANDGEAALEFLAHDRPDVVLMDVHMPKMDGFEATRKIMETQPLPIIICSATMHREEVATTFRALEAGAVAFVDKPVGLGHAGFNEMVKELTESIKLMSEVKVVKRWARLRPAAPVPAALKPTAAIKLIAIGASTGGPPVIQTILAGLPKNLPVPVLIVQHIAVGFLDGMVDWLARTTGWPVHLARNGEHSIPGHAYLAPDDFHLGIGLSGRILLSKEPLENGLRPAVSYLFRSVAKACGANAVGILLSGMGADGAAELALLKSQGAVTIAQNRQSCVVASMPGQAITLDGATLELAPEHIADTLMGLVGGGGTAP
jgi:two-component system chemotaxis response regulator CheB